MSDMALTSISSDVLLTTVKVRLADGSRLIVKLNHEHTVADLRMYINTARFVFNLIIHQTA